MPFTQNPKSKIHNGFTLIELLVVVGMTLIAATMAIPLYGNLQGSIDVNETVIDAVQLIRKARTLSFSSYQGGSYGVHFDSDNRRFVLYQGDNFLSRNQAFDMFLPISSGVIISQLPADFEAHFARGTGLSSQVGHFDIGHQSTDSIRIININNLGAVDAN